MTTSLKSAGGGTTSGNAVHTGRETYSVPIDGTELVDEFDQHFDALRELRLLAQAGSALAKYGAQLTHADAAVLFTTIACRCDRASKELDASIAYLTKRDAAQLVEAMKGAHQ